MIAFALSGAFARAQLAITEVMSQAWDGSDFWELTNFGTNDIPLTGYGFDDGSTLLAAAERNLFNGVTIRGGESILLVETNGGSTAEAFRASWGLASSVQVFFYPSNGLGFGSGGESLTLWLPAAFDALDSREIADSVNFGTATRGRTFTYHPSTGVFGLLSTNGLHGAFFATNLLDVGSPGTNSGPTPLVITEQPASVLANPGDMVSFQVQYRGVPRPVFLWFHDGTLISAARSPNLTVDSAQLGDAGIYTVVLSNAFQSVTSAPAMLTLRTEPVRPEFVVSPVDFRVFNDQEQAIFRAVATGLPAPTYQWSFNGTNIPGATAGTYILYSPQLHHSGVYSVVASNPRGSATNTARLFVTGRPPLRITEVMSNPSRGPGRADWWELTSFHDEPVDLIEYRFDDISRIPGLDALPRIAAAWRITNSVIIRPGESVIFVENLTAEEFRQWWGTTHLPPGLQIITYSGPNLNLDGTDGDGVGFWNMGAVDDLDFVAFAYFPGTTNNASFHSDPDQPQLPCCDDSMISQRCVNGAFVAKEGGDVGSPGWIRGRPEPCILSITREGTACRITWCSLPGRIYTVRYKSQLNDIAWTILNPVPSADTTSTYLDASSAGNGQRFYRVVLEP